MPDLDEQLRRYAGAVGDSVTPVALDRARSRSASRRRRRVVTLAAAAVAVLMVAGVVLVSRNEEEQPTRTTAPSSSVTSTPPPATSTTAPATRTSRTGPVVASTGTEYLVWSGEAGANDVSQRADGFAVDLRSGTVRPIPVAPIEPRSGATGVWTGRELVVCCGGNQRGGSQSAAAWDPGTGTWRILAEPPALVSQFFATSVWTGQVMVVVARGPAAAVYDPVADRWTEVEPPPLTARSPEAIWTGEEVVVWDSRYGAGASGGEVVDQGWRWAPGRPAWEPLPPLPAGSRTQLGSIGWTGEDVVVWGQSTADEAIGTGGRWRPGADAWRPVEPSPQGRVADPFVGTSGSQGMASDPEGGRVLVKALDGGDLRDALYVYDASADEWTTPGVAVPGFSPSITYALGSVLVPDEANPIVGRLPP